MVGFGQEQFSIAIYIANRPDLTPYSVLDQLQPLRLGEIEQIVQATGNHWRKIFNVSAKFIFELLNHEQEADLNALPTSWQLYRDQILFQDKSPIALLFSPPRLDRKNTIHIVAGRTYARELGLDNLIWLDEQFAISETQRLIVCPYLDYRQLSNARITRLVKLVEAMHSRA